MLSVPLPEFKRQLEDMLLDLQHLAGALQQLRDLLPENSEKRATVLTLIGRLNDANKKALRGTLDNTALQTEYNAIRSDLSDFIQTLQEQDFETAAPNTGGGQEKNSGARQGSVLYRIPHTMPLRQETTCVVRIAINEDAIVEEITIDEQTVLKDLSRISDLMQVELADPGRTAVFAIRSTSPAQQLITKEGYTEWFFYVEPLQQGVFPLEVKVSVLEMALNQIHRKELVFRETIQIVTNQPPPAPDDNVSKSASGDGFKTAGKAFAFAGETLSVRIPPQQPEAPYEAPTPPDASQSRGMRTLALFLAFIVLGSSATWALTPDATREWWVASIIEDDEKSYENYISKYPESPYREKAYYYRAIRSSKLANLRAYQQEYTDGVFREKIATRVASLETQALEDIRKNPSRENIQQFASQFPDTKRLPEVKKAVEARHDRRTELMAEVEDAYVTTARTRPSEQNIKNYLDDFPKSTKLTDIAQVAATHPELRAKVQPDIDAAVTRSVQAATSPDEVRNILPAVEIAASRTAAENVEKIVAQKPELKKQQKLQQQVKQTSEKVRLREKIESSERPQQDSILPPEERDWKKTLLVNTAAEYVYFTRKYPQSTHLAEARQRIKSFNLSIAALKQLNTDALKRLEQEK